MAINKIQAVLDSERAAREAEGIFDPSDQERAALKRAKVLMARLDRDKAELETLKSFIFDSMESRGAKALAVNGKNWALISDTHRTVVDAEKFKEEFPVLTAQYEEALARYTSRILVPNGRKAVKPA